MQIEEMRRQWEAAAPGWARWEPVIAAWLEPATLSMLDMAGLTAGAKVLDVACGAGSQTLRAALRVGPQGQVVACDIAESMLQHVRENADAAGLGNVTTLCAAAERLDLAAHSLDAAICRLGLMQFVAPVQALQAVRTALRPGGKFAAVVFSTPAANPFMAQSLQILLRHAGKPPPAPGQPGIFALAAPGLLENLLDSSGFVEVELRTVELVFRMPSAARTLAMMQESFGLYRAVLKDCPEEVRSAAWAEVSRLLDSFVSCGEFAGSGQVLVAAGTAPG
ncbi:MAG: class I SAM-dependent methyltransferase [Rhodocyclaceae bacterium]|nr:class I SAM-dependent methyltransferase [Rhodocyclaceae bacterium]